jgi:acrylyl-CoA reductase (NADPH)
MSFRGILLNNQPDFSASMRTIERAQLDEQAAAGDILVKLRYSTINYKDGLALSNKSPVVRKWPMVPGIDGAGVVEESSDPGLPVGSEVILNGFGVGETRWGCLAAYARLKAEWLIRMPHNMDARSSMAIGTAGYTAMLCIQALERQGLEPDQGEVLVTGAAGGVGSVAVSLLATRGYKVIASTGRASTADYLQRLGASQIVDRQSLATPGKPLQKERWAAVVDTVGSTTLSNALAQCKYGASIAACGLAGGMDLPTTVAPFILRNVQLLGIDSVMAPRALRENAWQDLSENLDRKHLAFMTTEISLEDCIDAGAKIVAGEVRGRLLVDLNRG